MANSHPPPKAKPFTAATTGLDECSILAKTSCPLLANTIASALFNPPNSEISAPATNALGPAPVMMTDLISLFFSISLSAVLRSVKTSLFNALSLSGRLMVMV